MKSGGGCMLRDQRSEKENESDLNPMENSTRGNYQKNQRRTGMLSVRFPDCMQKSGKG